MSGRLRADCGTSDDYGQATLLAPQPAAPVTTMNLTSFLSAPKINDTAPFPVEAVGLRRAGMRRTRSGSVISRSSNRRSRTMISTRCNRPQADRSGLQPSPEATASLAVRAFTVRGYCTCFSLNSYLAITENETALDTNTPSLRQTIGRFCIVRSNHLQETGLRYRACIE